MYNKLPNEHWIFKKHTNNIALLTELAIYLKSNKAGVSIKEKENMYDIFSSTDFYNPRLSLRNKPLDAINHKLDALTYYMFGYSDRVDGNLKFIFSPLGNLYLKYLNNPNKLTCIFSTMLFGMQFPHPASKSSLNFCLYPFRLIFTLLLDDRLNNKIYNYEIYKFLIYVNKLDKQKYEKLVYDILESRKDSDIEKFEYLKKNEYEIVKSTYEWQYYVSKLLEDVNVIKKNNGDSEIELYHPQKPNSTSLPTKRKINNGYFELTDISKPIVKILLSSYSVFSKPLAINNSSKKSDDVIKEIYSFYPKELLAYIGEPINDIHTQLLELPKLIEKYSLNPDNETSDKFEDVLEDAFNMFINVEAKKLSGAGKTDIECLYITEREVFAVEAKSTANKLVGINAGRLKRHRDLIGARYTIVVTPRYVPSVKYDISGQDIVIIKANTLSEYLYNNIIMDNRNMDYAEINDIIKANLGKDISLEMSELTLSKFG